MFQVAVRCGTILQRDREAVSSGVTMGIFGLKARADRLMSIVRWVVMLPMLAAACVGHAQGTSESSAGSAGPPGLPTDTGATVETVERSYQFSVPFAPNAVSPPQGPPGCKKEAVDLICRKDGAPVTSFQSETISKAGYMSGVVSQEVVDGCVRLRYVLGTDNKGVNGATCLEPMASLRILWRLKSDQGSITQPHQ
jgi:hypothetical protein